MLSLMTAKFSPEPRCAVAHLLGSAGGILEISADRLLHLLAAVQQPQHDEQRHHGGDEIRVGHLPGAAVVAAMRHLLLDDDGSRIAPY